MMQLNSFQLERYFAKYEFVVRYSLCSSDCESVTIRDLLALEPGSMQKFHTLSLGYTESTGAPELRTVISGLYPGIQPDQILVHSGAEEAIFNFMHANLHAGDHVIVHWPCYQSLYEIAAASGCEITFWKAREENRWQLDLSELRSAIRPNTRAIILNTPNNPTGYLMSRTDFADLNDLSMKKGVWLFSDEVYRESEYDSSLRLPSACEINPMAVSLGVISKTYGLPGLRIGWIATQNAEIFDRMSVIKDYTTICCSAPSEFLAALALRHREILIQRNLEILLSNLALLDDFFSTHSLLFHWLRPNAGSIAFPRLIGQDVEAFCHDLVTQAGVLLLPGTLFGDQENHFRLGFGRRNLPEALAKLAEFTDRLAVSG